MSEIKYPTQTTYFIAYTNNRICAWGVVEPNQEMSSLPLLVIQEEMQFV